VGASLRRALAGHDVRVETSARGALARIRAGERYDRIVCDLSMPGMDGIAFHEELTRLDPVQAAAVLFMTGGVFGERAQRFVETHRDLVLEKPLDLERLRRAIEASLAR